MRNKVWLLLAGGLLAALTVGALAARDKTPARPGAAADAGGEEEPKAKEEDKGQVADREAIRKASRAFAEAFAKGDAKAVAAFWTDRGEYHDDHTGETIRGRAAIEKAYAEFFKAKPKSKIEVEIRAIRFPSRDTAVEDGVLRLKTPGPDLPTSTWYSALHVREKGGWKIASVREWGAAQDKLDDLGWLVGTWVAKAKKAEVHLHFEWNKAKSQIHSTFTVKEGGRVTSSGSQVIRLDPKTGLLRSWTFDEGGGHGQALWFRDGNRWVQDSVGVLPDGRDAVAFNVLTRVSDDEFTWRSVDRAVGDVGLPDTDPIKVTRVRAGK